MMNNNNFGTNSKVIKKLQNSIFYASIMVNYGYKYHCELFILQTSNLRNGIRQSMVVIRRNNFLKQSFYKIILENCPE